jgi:hypothetical protein
MAPPGALTVIHATDLGGELRASWTSGLDRGEDGGDEQQQKSDSRHGTSFQKVLLDSILKNPESLELHRSYIRRDQCAMMLITDESQGNVL